MDTFERSIVEAIKEATDVRLEINGSDVNKKRLGVRPITNKRLAHEIALAYQNYFNFMERERRKNEKTIL